MDELIIEKVENFKAFVKTLIPSDMHDRITSLPIDLSKLDLFRLFLLTGGTPDSLHDILMKKFGIDVSALDEADSTKIRDYCDCIFELLCLRLE